MIYDKNNARNRDMYSILKWTGKLYLSTEIGKNSNKSVLELYRKYGT